jgi:hypothetical protein
MAAPTLTQIRQGLANTLTSAISTLNIYSVDQDVNTPPFLVVTPAQGAGTQFVNWEQTEDGAATWFLTVRVAVSNATTPGAEAALDPWLASDGATSIKAIIEASPSLGLGPDTVYATVRGARAYGIFDIRGASYLGAEWDVVVLA